MKRLIAAAKDVNGSVRVPVVLIGIVLTLLVQLGIGVWWTSKLDARVEILEKWVESNSCYVDDIKYNKSWIQENKDAVRAIPVMSETLKNMNTSINEIKHYWGIKNGSVKGKKDNDNG